MTPLDDDRTAAAAHRAERSVALDAAAPAAARPGAPGSCRRTAGRAAPDPNVHRAAHALVRGGWVQNGWFAHRTERDELRASTGGTRTAVRHGPGRLQMHRSERNYA